MRTTVVPPPDMAQARPEDRGMSQSKPSLVILEQGQAKTGHSPLHEPRWLCCSLCLRSTSRKPRHARGLRSLLGRGDQAAERRRGQELTVAAAVTGPRLHSDCPQESACWAVLGREAAWIVLLVFERRAVPWVFATQETSLFSDGRSWLSGTRA